MDRFIRESECERITGLSRSTRRRYEEVGQFPKRYKLSLGVVAYKESEIAAWMESFSPD